MEEVLPQPQPKAENKPVNDVEANKVMAAVGYIGILCLIPLLFAKDSAFARFHGKQGLVIFLCEVALGVIGSVFSGMFLSGVNMMGGFFMINGIIMLINLALLVLSIAGIIKAFSGERWEAPVIGQWAASLKF